jgi:hypothetical protein
MGEGLLLLGLLFLLGGKKKDAAPSLGTAEPGDDDDAPLPADLEGIPAGEPPPADFQPMDSADVDGLLFKYMSPDPVGGGVLYQVRWGDNLSKLARRVGVPDDQVVTYIQRITAVVANLSHYGTPLSQSNNWPSYYAVDVEGKSEPYTLFHALLPRNDDFVAKLEAGQEPVGWTGSPTGRYGVLWLSSPTGDPELPQDLQRLFPTLYGGG